MKVMKWMKLKKKQKAWIDAVVNDTEPVVETGTSNGSYKNSWKRFISLQNQAKQFTLNNIIR